MKDHPAIEELSAYLDGEADDPRALEAHLATCANCAARILELRHVTTALRQLTPPQTRSDFAPRVLERIAHDEATAPPNLLPFRFRPALRLALAAASVLFVVSAAYLTLRTAETPQTPPAVTALVESDALESIQLDTDPLEAAANETAREVVAALTLQGVDTEELTEAEAFDEGWTPDSDVGLLIDSAFSRMMENAWEVEEDPIDLIYGANSADGNALIEILVNNFNEGMAS